MKIFRILLGIFFLFFLYSSFEVIFDNTRTTEHLGAFIGVAISIFGLTFVYKKPFYISHKE